jgi:3-dehydroquinate dehydratase II
MKKIAILNGPNLDRLGKREPHIYGNNTIQDLEVLIAKNAEQLDIAVEFFQSNHEGALIDKINALSETGIDGVILNPGALAHTSVALRDALAGSGLTIVEVHISNLYQREDFRQKSLTAGAVKGVICGLGFEGYLSALRFFAEN